MERAREDLIKGGGRRMKKARKCLIAYGLEHAISHAIEDGEHVPVLRALIELGAKLWHTSWNVACYTGNFKIMEFLDNEGYWSEINTEAISCAIRAGQLKVAKWLRAHDPPAPWNVHATNACLAALAKKAGMPIMTIEDGNPDHESREYQPGERIEFFGQQPKDVPVAVLVKMAKWLVSEGAPCAAEMAEEVKKMAPRGMDWNFEDGDYETMLEILREKHLGKMNSESFDPSIMKKSQSLTVSFEEALDIFTGKMKATERMQRAMSAGNMKRVVDIMWETGVFPDKINNIPFDTFLRGEGCPDPDQSQPQPESQSQSQPPAMSLEEVSALSAATGRAASISMTASLDFEQASGIPTEYLKNLLLQNGVDITGCHERSDLIEKLKALYELNTHYELETLYPIEEAMRMINS